MRHWITIAVAAGSLMLPAAVGAQATAPETFSTKPLRLVVPLPAGGPSDFIARQAAQHLATALGQAVVVDNKPGANGLIAAREVAAADSDGHTLLYAPGSMIASPLLAKGSGFDWVQQLAPLGKVARVPFGLAVHSGVPASSVAELARLARAQPGQLNVATSTPSEVMAAAQFMTAAGVALTRVPYRGGPQAMPDLLAGRVQVTFGPLSVLQPHVKSGSLRLLAVLAPERNAAFPEVPTMREAGYATVSVPTWQALYVSSRASSDTKHRLASAVAAAAAHPEFRSALVQRMLAVESGSPQELSATISSELAAWSSLVDEYKLTAD
jgi:tripartite-type tricarboxylate transporter receptor subunit TctC